MIYGVRELATALNKRGGHETTSRYTHPALVTATIHEWPARRQSPAIKAAAIRRTPLKYQ